MLVFHHDGPGRLRQRDDYIWADTDWAWSAETLYIYDGNRVIQERSGDPGGSGNTPTIRFEYAPAAPALQIPPSSTPIRLLLSSL